VPDIEGVKVSGPASDGDPLRGIAAAIVCISVVGVATSLTIPLLSLMLHHRGIPEFWIGINTASAGLAGLIASPLTAGFVRVLGVKTAIFLSVVAGCLALLLLPFTPFWAWFPLRFVLVGAITVIFVISEFWINSAAPEHRRGLIIGIYGSVLSGGFALGPAILALTGSQGMLPIVIAIAIMLLALIPVSLASSSAPQIVSKSRFSLLALLMVAPAAILASFVFGAAESSFFGFLALWGAKIGMTESAAALLITAIGLGNMLLQIPIGLLADRVNRSLLLVVCAAGACGGIGLVFLFIGSYSVLFGVFFLAGGMAAGLYTVGLTSLGTRFSGAELASANGLFVMMYAVGMIIGPLTSGAAMQVSPSYGLLVVLMALFGGYAILAGVRLAMRTGRP